MARLIDAEKTFEVLIEYYHQRTTFQHYALREALDRVPTVDAVKHGHWIYERLNDTRGGSYSVVYCSNCQAHVPWVTKYCLNCGAKMDEVEE